MRKTYRAGNWLRGYYEGEFSSLEEAWSYLSARILLGYPTDDPDGKRGISMYAKEKNAYGFDQFILCKQDYTERNSLIKEEVLKRVKTIGAWLI